MGRIKSTLVKRTSKKLLQLHPSFNESFERNKKILASNMPSKKIRNKIAGYISRLNRMKREAISKPVKKAVQEEMSQTPEYQFA
jgi:small subunit ribosomal protein S17e